MPRRRRSGFGSVDCCCGRDGVHRGLRLGQRGVEGLLGNAGVFALAHDEQPVELVDVDRRIAGGTLDHRKEGELASPAYGGGQCGSFGGGDGAHAAPPSPCHFSLPGAQPGARVGLIGIVHHLVHSAVEGSIALPAVFAASSIARASISSVLIRFTIQFTTPWTKRAITGLDAGRARGHRKCPISSTLPQVRGSSAGPRGKRTSPRPRRQFVG